MPIASIQMLCLGRQVRRAQHEKAQVGPASDFVIVSYIGVSDLEVGINPTLLASRLRQYIFLMILSIKFLNAFHADTPGS